MPSANFIGIIVVLVVAAEFVVCTEDIFSRTRAKRFHSNEVHPRFRRELPEVPEERGHGPSLPLALRPLRVLAGEGFPDDFVDHPKIQQGIGEKQDDALHIHAQQGSTPGSTGIRGAFAKIGWKFSSLASNIKRVAGIRKNEDEQSTSSIGTEVIQNSADVDTKSSIEGSPFSRTLTSGGPVVRKDGQNLGVGHRTKFSLCNVFNCNLALVKKPNLDRSVSNSPQEIEIRETVRNSLRSEDASTEVDTVVYRNNLGEQGGDLKISHSFSDRTSLSGHVKGNNRGELKGDLDLEHSFGDRTSLNAHAYAKHGEDMGGDVTVNHNLNDRTFINLGVNGNNRGYLEGDLNVAHRLTDRTSLAGRAHASNQGDREGDISVKHRLNDRTSLDGHAHADDQGELKGEVGVSHKLSDRTSLRSVVSASRGNLEGDLDVTHQLSDHTSLKAGVNGNTRGDFSGDFGVTHHLDGRTSLSGRTYGDNEGTFGGEVSLKRRLSDSTSLDAEAAANNRGEIEAKLGIEHQFSDSTSLGAGAHANSQGDVGVGLSITKTFLRRR